MLNALIFDEKNESVPFVFTRMQSVSVRSCDFFEAKMRAKTTGLIVVVLSLTACTTWRSIFEREPDRALATWDGVRQSVIRCATQGLTTTQQQEVEAQLTKRKASRPLTLVGGVVDVYVHVIRQGKTVPDGDISDAIVNEQVKVLNQDFAATGWSFRLAATDRTTNVQWYRRCHEPAVEQAMKRSLRQGGADKLNVYICMPNNRTLGWSSLPHHYGSSPHADGVVIAAATLPGGPAVPFHQGGTLTHQVGHWFGLYHTFQGGCGQPNDVVADTPPEQRPAFTCKDARDSCPGDGPDPVQNFMDFADDQCAQRWTAGQDARMDAVFTAFRVGL